VTKPTECHPDRPHYAHGQCRQCYMAERRGTFLSQQAEYVRRYNTPERTRRYKLTRYGLTPEQYDKLLAEQGGTCAICQGPPGGRWGRYCVDHDHVTGAVRGLLCLRCNRAIGLVEDDTAVLRKMITYLRPQAKDWRKDGMTPEEQ
jgi:hypothetical protein